GDILQNTASKYPEKEALVDPRDRVTYAQLAQRADRLALGLLEIGIQKGDRIIVQLPNCIEFVYVFFALAKIGALGVLALRQHRGREIGYLASMSEAVGIVAPGRFRDFDYIQMIEELRPEVPGLKHVILMAEQAPAGMHSISQLLEQQEPETPSSHRLARARPDPNDVAFLLTTGGTTAFPKGVPRTHNEYICNSVRNNEPRSYTPSTVFLLNVPIAHNAALLRLVGILEVGGKMIIHPNLSDPEEMAELIQKEKVTQTHMVPTQLVDLLNYPQLHQYDTGSLRIVESGGAHVPSELVRNAVATFGCKFINTFGMAEGPIIFTRLNDPFETVCDTVGRPCCPDDELKIVDEAGRELPPGQEGELVSRGPHVIRGYYRNPEENKRAFDDDGFFHTGDLATIDQDGNLRITGRKKDMILRGGENVSAVELEELLVTHPKVADAAVIGMPDPRLGEKVCAYIKPKPEETITFDELIAFLRKKQIASFKLPERIEVIEQFPLTAIGKISKKDLREDIAGKLGAEGKL
ncbi:MAG: (2,3-dihydroxybenzoyl)adenylate synthase, partial [Dehalococcoidia bacterium]